MSKDELPRARRRRLTRRVATRRLSDRLTFVFGGDPPSGLTAGTFAKRPALGCNCRKRTHGRPRVACGMCGIGDRERVYRWRNQVREQVTESMQFAMRGTTDPSVVQKAVARMLIDIEDGTDLSDFAHAAVAISAVGIALKQAVENGLDLREAVAVARERVGA